MYVAYGGSYITVWLQRRREELWARKMKGQVRIVLYRDEIMKTEKVQGVQQV